MTSTDKPTGRAKAARPTRADAVHFDTRDWIQVGLEELAERGVDGVKVEVLAKRLNVTKGSFYHWFKDRETFLAAMLSDWRRRATLDIIDGLERRTTEPSERLKRLLRLPLGSRSSAWGATVELAVRLWGQSDARARAALEEVDQVRLRYLEGLLQALGVDKQDAERRAVLAYCYMRVSGSLIDRDDQATMEACEAILKGC